MSSQGASTPHGEVAASFAQALIDRNFDRAHGLLTLNARRTWSTDALRTSYEEMVEYFDSPPTKVQVTTVMDDWPDKQPTDVGWAYASIEAESELEAVVVIVATEGGRHLVRDIEWGRP